MAWLQPGRLLALCASLAFIHWFGPGEIWTLLKIFHPGEFKFILYLISVSSKHISIPMSYQKLHWFPLNERTLLTCEEYKYCKI